MSKLSNLFGIKKGDLSLITENPDAFKSQSNTTLLRKDKQVKAKGSYSYLKDPNGDPNDENNKVKFEFPTHITLESAYWTRLTVRDHYINRAGAETRTSQVFGGVFKPVKMKVEVEIDGQTMLLQDLVRELIIEHSVAKTPEEINKIIEDSNLLSGFKNGMPLMFQQMGASENGFQHAIEVFRSAGAVDDLISMKGNNRFHTCYDMKNKQGLEVVSFELGSSDRSQSKTGQGFVDIPDAVIGNFLRVVENKTQNAVLRKEIEEHAASWSQAEIKAKQAKADSALNMSRQYPIIWSGAAQRKDMTEGGETVKRDKYDAVNAPCGRWTVLVNDETVDLDVWSNSTKRPANAVTTQVATVNTTVNPF